MKLVIHSKSSVHMSQDDFVISVAECARGRSRGIRMLCSKASMTLEKPQTYIISIVFCNFNKTIARVFWKLNQFSKRVNIENARAVSLRRPGSNCGSCQLPKLSAVPTMLSVFNVHNLAFSSVGVYYIYNLFSILDGCSTSVTGWCVPTKRVLQGS